MTKFFLAFAFLALIAASPAQARHHYRHHGGRFHVHRVHGHWHYAPQRDRGYAEADDWSRPTRHEGRRHRTRYSGGRGLSAPCATARRLGGPCGCFASELLFGHSVRGLWLAANWFQFPRTAAKPGAVIVRQHHVVVIEAVHGSRATVHDSWGIHEVSLAGKTVVDPHGMLSSAFREARSGFAHEHSRHHVHFARYRASRHPLSSSLSRKRVRQRGELVMVRCLIECLGVISLIGVLCVLAIGIFVWWFEPNLGSALR